MWYRDTGSYWTALRADFGTKSYFRKSLSQYMTNVTCYLIVQALISKNKSHLTSTLLPGSHNCAISTDSVPICPQADYIDRWEIAWKEDVTAEMLKNLTAYQRFAVPGNVYTKSSIALESRAAQKIRVRTKSGHWYIDHQRQGSPDSCDYAIHIVMQAS